MFRNTKRNEGIFFPDDCYHKHTTGANFCATESDGKKGEEKTSKTLIILFGQFLNRQNSQFFEHGSILERTTAY